MISTIDLPSAQEEVVMDSDSAVLEKIADMGTPGGEVEFDPAEAEQVGAFYEDALPESEAWESRFDHVTQLEG